MSVRTILNLDLCPPLLSEVEAQEEQSFTEEDLTAYLSEVEERNQANLLDIFWFSLNSALAKRAAAKINWYLA